jgi:transposase-like protein
MLPDSDHIVRPDCPKCGAHTYLMRIMPRSAGMEVRWFECAKCSHLVEQLVKSVPRPRRDPSDPFRKV